MAVYTFVGPGVQVLADVILCAPRLQAQGVAAEICAWVGQLILWKQGVDCLWNFYGAGIGTQAFALQAGAGWYDEFFAEVAERVLRIERVCEIFGE